VTEKRSSFNRLVIIVAGLWIGVLVAGGLIVALMYFGVGPFKLSPSDTANSPTALLEDGTLASDFELDDVNGQKVRLSDLRGQVVVVNFWATWCIPCVQEMPAFQNYQLQYPNFTMIGIDVQEDPKLVADFIQKRGFEYRILLDRNGKVGQNYKVTYFPSTFFIDQNGMIRFRHFGSISENQLEYYLETLGVIPPGNTSSGGTQP
jgi:cytochrome c biogenesis protein CcmG, thiol:disulfide interchange protein DsbE